MHISYEFRSYLADILEAYVNQSTIRLVGGDYRARGSSRSLYRRSMGNGM